MPSASVRQVLLATILAILLGLFCRTFLMLPIAVRSGSMGETLLDGDHVIFGRLIYSQLAGLGSFFPVREPRRGDVVLLVGPEGKSLVKRCVAVPGDVLEIRRGRVMLDGHLQEEPWATISVGDQDHPSVRLGTDEYFVLGDHRSRSKDSRHWGPVSRRRLRGRAVLIYWSAPPLAPEGWDTMWQRWQQRILSTRWDRWWRLVH